MRCEKFIAFFLIESPYKRLFTKSQMLSTDSGLKFEFQNIFERTWTNSKIAQFSKGLLSHESWWK